MEVRLETSARATKDLDLVARAMPDDGDRIREALLGSLLEDPDGDGFVFEVGNPRALAADDAGRPAWELSLRAELGGSVFALVKLNVVTRESEIVATERLPLPGVLNFADIPSAEVEVVDRAQHFAEKIHAITRTYHDRPSSRVKDLPDVILLIEDGLKPSAELAGTIDHVFNERRTHPVPEVLPDPPADWEARYAELAQELDIGPKTVAEAMAVVRPFWAETLSFREKES